MARLTIRWLHIFSAIYNVLFVYTPLHNWQHGLAVVQYVTMPLLVITGVLMVRGRRKYSATCH